MRNVVQAPGGYSPKIPIRVCAAQRGRDFGTPYLERGIIFRTHESFKLSAATCYSYKPVKLVKAKLVIENLLVCCVLKSNKQRNNLKNRALESYAILERGIKN